MNKSLIILAFLIASFQISALTLTQENIHHEFQIKNHQASEMIVVNKSGSGEKSFDHLTALAPVDLINSDGKVRSPQLYKGIPVYGSEVIYHVVENRIVDAFGRIAKIQDLDLEHKISKENALEIISLGYNDFQVESIEKMIYPTNKDNYLVWKIIEDGFDRKLEIFIDAQTGQIIDSFNTINHSTHSGIGHGLKNVKRKIKISKEDDNYVLKSTGNFAFETYDMTNFQGPLANLSLPGELYKQVEKTWSDNAASEAHYFTGKFLKLLKKKFNRLSYDGKGGKVISSVHFGTNYVNAFWNGKQMVYGDGDEKYSTFLSGGLDVIAHEVSHGITSHTSKLIYRNESGALNEAFSDIMASYAEYKIQRKNFDWKIGEDIWTPEIDGDALRYMNDPTKDKERIPDEASEARKELYSRDWYPDRYLGTGDNGGVHINSGIANLAFVLLSDGGTHPRSLSSIKVQSIGINKAIQIFYKGFTEYLVSSSTFKDARLACIKAAAELYGQQYAKIVAQAWSAVGVL